MPFEAASRKVPLTIVAGVVAVLYVAREFLLPLALAILISFLLAPLIRGFEKCHLGRISSVLLATALTFAVIGGLGYIVVGQIIDLATKLPEYKANLQEKIESIRPSGTGPLQKAAETMRDLSDEMSGTPGSSASSTATAQSAGVEPVPVQVVYTAQNAFSTLNQYIAPVLAPLGSAAVVIVFVIFILLEREDLRDRFIHLVGRGRLHLTTQAIDEAGQRVSRYLVAQLIVNVTYGVPIGIALYFIGIPNAVLWGLLATILRFIPYLGPVLASGFPLALSLAVAPGWEAPLLTAGLFILVELISNNVVEPWLYGASTGLSPIAIIVSAAFWTWLWGALGLVLATPLTVCVVVMAKYLPELAFLDLLLGNRPPIAPTDRCFQRLLAQDEEEVVELLETQISERGLTVTLDEVLLPTVRQIEDEFRAGSLPEASHREMLHSVREALAHVGESPSKANDVKAASERPPSGTLQLLCLPASNEADELTALMLARLLNEAGFTVEVLSAKSLAGEMIEKAATAQPHWALVSSLAPTSAMQATFLVKRLRQQLPETRLIAGLWGDADENARRIERLRRSGADDVFTSLKDAAAEVALQISCRELPAVNATTNPPAPILAPTAPS